MTTHSATSRAKLNLTLRIVATRSDGFHELESLVTQINLSDRVTVHLRDDAELTLECDDASIPCDDTNLAWRAAHALRQLTGTRRGADLRLTKRIPAGAGLGGGSSNAATTLWLLNHLWNLGLGRDQLAEVGAQVGSDVPLFLYGPLCVLRGRGERIEELANPLPMWAALLLPELHCSTPEVYAAWDRQPEHLPRPNIDEVLAARRSAVELMERLFNDLQEPAFAVEPQLADIAERVILATGAGVRLTGSGAALFRLFDDAPSAARFALAASTATGVRTDIVALRTE